MPTGYRPRQALAPGPQRHPAPPDHRPARVVEEYGLVGGNIFRFHGELSVSQLFHMRPAPGCYAGFRARPVPGASVRDHGGGGVTAIPAPSRSSAKIQVRRLVMTARGASLPQREQNRHRRSRPLV